MRIVSACLLSMAMGLGSAPLVQAQHLFGPAPVQQSMPHTAPSESVVPPISQPMQQQILTSPGQPTLESLPPEPMSPAGMDADIPTVPIVPSSGNAPTDLELLPTQPSTGGSVDITDLISTSRELNRAKNLARQAAEIYNGGLQNYRAESAMHTAGVAAPYVDRGTDWVFRFQGGLPGATVMTIESEIRVDKSSFQTEVLYNGPLRP
ncbi:MAG: hypothetical protein ACFCU9_02045 [Cyanophyceae cyanobacterium]